MRKERMENLTTTGKIAEKRDRGQQRITFVKSLCHLLNITTFQLIKSVKDGVLWRSMVANVLKGKGTRKKKMLLQKDFKCAVECALLCATLFPSCSSYNFFSNDSACQFFTNLPNHFSVKRSLVDQKCFYYFQDRNDLLQQDKLANLAIRKPTSASSLNPPAAIFNSSYAVDGDRSALININNCFHTILQPPNWLAVDLLDVFSVRYVMLVNRGDCCGKRLSYYKVGLSMTLSSSVNNSNYDLCGQYPRETETAFWYIILCKNYSYGHRFVIVQSVDTNALTVCELEVYGQLFVTLV
ncbi:hypothetical protein HELRODRAFT_178975 [Helobdella robusta]|uniref:Fucolectin tachylectin-4 pentraxin-1 domain-containing protein n=1 Tax=Helobdella robusta TaxID=6412 RepID=T1FDZ7_HELRO|nr:hypothetical protein HELRODRAFT_178975 [Helobdella robusta]ESN95792.1 hypothetical protein HELRODRAFT_178975 [Helobdella robusta]